MPPESPAAAPALVARSPQMLEVLRKTIRLRTSDAPVLVLGETGTGKEVVARAIHQGHPERPFVLVDCSALVDTLIESELFGHARGAFTSAKDEKRGLLEMADGGTAFFDEIGELPLHVQGKLLRAIQNKEIRPVGSVQVRRSNFRIIAATNRDLAQEVGRGHFRRDLYYRLNVVTLRLPPLRERRDEIPALIEHFLERHGRRYTLSQEAFDAMLAYDWPGNVRELENSIERMVAMNSGPVLHTADLPTFVQTARIAAQAEKLARAVAASAGRTAAADPSKPRNIVPLDQAERQAIREALEFTGGNRGQAAELLGIGRTTLYRKIKEYKLG